MAMDGPWHDDVPLKVEFVAQKGNCVFSVRQYAAEELIGYLEGIEVSSDSMYTLRLDAKIIEPTGVFRYLAHSCDPNSAFEDAGRQLFARRAIEVGDEVTIDYLSTEPVITNPFVCKCGASNCRGEIARGLSKA